MTYVIQVNNLCKQYQIGDKLNSLRRALRGGGVSAENANTHWAVKGVSFSLKPGESLGIIGPNGAGKTTILKMLAQVTKPTSGTVTMNGRFSALIALGAGFHPELTGRENVFLNGAILGMKRAEIKARFDEIIDFAGIEQFIDTPVKRYSSGMYARLGFAIAAHVDPDILLVDEVLAVGDYAFQQKCYMRMENLIANGATIIFISHNLQAIRKVCQRGLVMYRGASIFQGNINEAISAYSTAIRDAARKMPTEIPKEGGLTQRVMSFDAEIQKVQLFNKKGQSTNQLKSGDAVTIVVNVSFQRVVRKPIFGFFIRTHDGYLAYTTTTKWQEQQTPDFVPGQTCQVTFHIALPLLNGEYFLGVDIASNDLKYYYDRIEHALSFWVAGSNSAEGLIDLDAKISIET